MATSYSARVRMRLGLGQSCAALLLLLLLLVCTASGRAARQDGLVDCSPSKSLEATKTIEKYVFEHARSAFGIDAPKDLPSQCNLLPWKDMHHSHNELRDLRPGYRKYFKCKKCGKQFKTSEYLDKHIVDRHLSGDKKTEESSTSANICFATFCSFLPCDKDSPTLLARLHERHPERARVAHECRRVMASCFPPSLSDDFKRAHEYFERTFCEGKALAEVAPTTTASRRADAPSSIWGVLSKAIMLFIVFFYMYTFFVQSQATPEPRGLGPIPQQRAMSKPTTQTTPVKPVRRRNVQESRDSGGPAIAALGQFSDV